MNAAHLHLLVNHLPILGILFGLFVLIAGLLLNQTLIRRVALVGLIVAGVSALPANKTGEEAEEIVEHLEGVSHDLIHEHEEKAEAFLLVAGGLALLSAVGLWAELKNHAQRKMLNYLVLAVAAGAMFMAAGVGNSGGEIRHPEIRKDFVMPAKSEAEHAEH